jgi:hypothetical protein
VRKSIRRIFDNSLSSLSRIAGTWRYREKLCIKRIIIFNFQGANDRLIQPLSE